jgi:hypothetical protein
MVVRGAEREAHYSPPSSAEVKNGKAVTSEPPYIFMTTFLIHKSVGKLSSRALNAPTSI